MYAERMKVSPSTAVESPAGAMPNRHALVPSVNVRDSPLELVISRTSSSMGTLMVGLLKVKSRVEVLEAREQGTKAAPSELSYWAPTEV